MRKVLLLACIICLALAATAQKKKKILVPYLKGDLWGYSDTTGKIIIKPQFQEAGFFKEDNNMYYAQGKINDKDVLITEDGKFIEDEFTDGGISMMSMFEEGSRIFFTEEKSDPNIKGYVYDKQKNSIVLSDKYGTCYSFFNDRKGMFVQEKSSQLIGAIDPAGNVLIPFQYEHSIETYGPRNEYIRTKKGGLFGIIDLKGQDVLPFKYSSLDPISHDGTHLLGNTGGGYQVIDIHGTMLFPDLVFNAKYANGMICCRRAGYYGYLDTNGNIAIPFKYRVAAEFGESPAEGDFAYVTNKEGVSFFISKSGREFYSK
ncbi:WG repeat-containing protein [Chitinophaga tropicalis]|uniref:WG repeat protein n=1 Tax=Chitinophaga tropicalis TaxID=2683588 RepID=A0A7K1U4D6_9BACT|nr:WG repeat-containing protein [Chitinophaga tropicalis]MVT09212.1 hypothetical protein [Chitinophaga tropicalis]